ncbi:MAG TPA: ABC transporter substrate-binding protein [Candidatus Acidoferrum sp.]|nr:ABC transporter substrate-binding protein [Candidatus Acidoferrum sp.]
MRDLSMSPLMPRRDFLRFSGLAVVPLLAGVGPSPVSAAATATPAAAIRRGGVLVGAINWTYPTLDPHLSTIGVLPGYGAMFDALVRFELSDPKTGHHRVVGQLAESWDQPDPRTYVFKLKRGVKFHDGSLFDAEVAKWNVLRMRDHPKSSRKNYLADVESVEARDKSTLVIKHKAARPAFLPILAYHYAGKAHMISKAAMEKLGEEGFARNPVGSGPFKFKQWITDDRVVLERNPDYHESGLDGKPLPYLDGTVWRYIPDPTVSLVDMRAGSLHVLEWVPTKDVANIKTDPSFATYDMPWAGQVYFQVGFNTGVPPFNNVLVRRAAVHGIDREGMAKALGFGIGVPHYYPKFMSGALGYDEGLPKNEYDPAKVKSLLKEAGLADEVSIELKVIAREPENTIGEFVQQMWTNVGLKTKLVSMERLSWIDAVRAKNFQACFWRGTPGGAVVDPDIQRARIMCGGENNWSQFCDPEIDRLMDEGGKLSISINGERFIVRFCA